MMIEKKNRTIVLPSMAWLLAMLASAAQAVPPISPLATPQYSFRVGSPSVLDSSVDASSVLFQQGLKARVLFDSNGFGLDDPADDVDALSGATMTEPPAFFILMFSVDEKSFGAARPDTLAIEADVPYNTWDQAWRGHQAGDMYMSCTVFNGGQDEPTRVIQASDVVPNNVLVTNNYDEGGVDFAARPVTSAEDVMVAGTTQDVVDATAYLSTNDFFFSVSQGSPSLPRLSTDASGADLFFYDATVGRVSLYATAAALGLAASDDIDAMIVVDADLDKQFGADDLVFFSLSPNSPSLATIPGVSPVAGAADIFLSHAGRGLSVLAPAGVLGLGDAADNVDALELDYCVGAMEYAARHGIRNPGGSGQYSPPPSATTIRPGNRGGNGKGNGSGN